jgi:flagellar motor switch protein FliN
MSTQTSRAIEPQPAEMNDLKPDAPDAGANRELNLDVVLDIPVTLSMEVGRSRVSIRNLLQLSQGSVVELDRATGEPLDVYVNGTLIAHGEVVVVNDKFGIRLTDVISPAERIRKLKYADSRDAAAGRYRHSTAAHPGETDLATDAPARVDIDAAVTVPVRQRARQGVVGRPCRSAILP